MYSLYKLTFSSGKSYIGQTVRKMTVRIAQHKRVTKSGSKLAVHCAWRMYGDPDVVIIGEFDSQEALHAAEISAIKDQNTLTPFGYNISNGGDTSPATRKEVADKIGLTSLGRRHSAATKAAMADSSKTNWESKEYREKISLALKAAWTPEMRAARSFMIKEAWKRRKAAGWTMPESTKNKLSKKIVSEETREKMSVAAKGKKKPIRSAETCEKLSSIVKSSWLDEETRAKRSAAISKALKAKHAGMSDDQKAAFNEVRKRAGETRRNKRIESTEKE